MSILCKKNTLPKAICRITKELLFNSALVANGHKNCVAKVIYALLTH